MTTFEVLAKNETGGWLAHAFDCFGGVPRMLASDNCATAADRSAIYVTLVNGRVLFIASKKGIGN